LEIESATKDVGMKISRVLRTLEMLLVIEGNAAEVKVGGQQERLNLFCSHRAVHRRLAMTEPRQACIHD
jgi:hypothetical protein